MKIANACKYLILNQSKLSRKQAPKKKRKKKGGGGGGDGEAL